MTTPNFKKFDIEAYKPGKSKVKKLKNVIKLSANESALGISPKAEKVLSNKKLNLETGTKWWVIKAQIHAGGRGKGGGVKLAHNRDDVESLAKQILGMNLVTHQTGPEGKVVKRLYIEETLNISKEF